MPSMHLQAKFGIEIFPLLRDIQSNTTWYCMVLMQRTNMFCSFIRNNIMSRCFLLSNMAAQRLSIRVVYIAWALGSRLVLTLDDNRCKC